MREQREMLDFYDLGPRLNLFYTLHIASDDLKQYEDLIKDYANTYISEHKLEKDPEYHINSLTKAELMENIYEYDGVNEIDHELAKRKLATLGVSFNDETVATIREIRKRDKIKSYTEMKPFVIAGYFFAPLGGFFGIFNGYFFMERKNSSTIRRTLLCP